MFLDTLYMIMKDESNLVVVIAHECLDHDFIQSLHILVLLIADPVKSIGLLTSECYKIGMTTFLTFAFHTKRTHGITLHFLI